jgi:hypothetical protein
MNGLSDKISEWLQEVIEPDKLQSIYSLVKGTVKIYISHQWQRFYGTGGLTEKFIVEHLNNPMPDFWNETMGKALEQFIKGMGG